MGKINCRYAKRSESGNITLFLALVLTLILSFLFSLLEAARVQSLTFLAERKLLLRLESAFGEYNVPMWQEYRMLFLDGSCGNEKLDLALLEGNILEDAYLEQKSSGFYKMGLKNLEITAYGLATDYNGAAFEEQACKAVKEQLAEGAAQALSEKLGKGKEIAEDRQSVEEKWDLAKNALKEAEEFDEPEAGESEDTAEKATEENLSTTSQDLPINPMDEVDLLKKSSLLLMVVEDPSQISGKAILEQDTLRKRGKETGTMEKLESTNFRNLCFLQYLNYYFSCLSGQGESRSGSHALDYELEYCIAGKNSDYENLDQVVKELLLIREVGNFMTIMQDGKKQALALEIATAAVGFTGIVPLVQAVKIGILLAWSYIESILDMRCLLSGKKVPLIKKVSEWKSDVSVGTEALKGKTEDKTGEEGLSYREYLLILLLQVKESVLSYRAMEIVEKNIRVLTGKEDFCMDHQIYSIRASGLFGAEPLFLGFVTIGNKVDGMFHFKAKQQVSYL